MYCNVKENTINHLKKKGLVNEYMVIKTAMFYDENNKLSNLARTKYNVTNKGKLFNVERLANDNYKAVINEKFFSELQTNHNIYIDSQKKSEEKTNVIFDSELAKTIQTKLEKLYPEIKLNITNKPIWEQEGVGVYNQRENKRKAYLAIIDYYNSLEENVEENQEELETRKLKVGRLDSLQVMLEEPISYDYNQEEQKYEYTYSDVIENIYKNYSNAIGRTSSYRGDLKTYIASGDAIVYKPFYADDSVLVGQLYNDMFITSHFAPTSLRNGVELIKEAADSPMPIIIAVPDYQSNQLNKAGFRFITQVPQYFAGEIVMKNVMVNDAVTDADLKKLMDYFTRNYNQKNEANQIIGQANIKAMTVLIDAINQKQDTLPHEYAHHYISWFRNTPLVQQAIKKWGSEEALVQSIGEQVVLQKGEAYNWWKNFVDFIINKFKSLSSLDKKELTKILTDAFLTRQDLNETGTSSMYLRDGNSYNYLDIDSSMLQKMGYNINEIGQILKKIC